MGYRMGKRRTRPDMSAAEARSVQQAAARAALPSRGASHPQAAARAGATTATQVMPTTVLIENVSHHMDDEEQDWFPGPGRFGPQLQNSGTGCSS